MGAVCFHHVGDIGTRFEFVVRDCDESLVNLADASAGLTAYFRAPDGTVTSFSATMEGDGSGGTAYYVTANATDLGSAGVWTRWLVAVFTGGADLTSSPVSFRVHDNDNGV